MNLPWKKNDKKSKAAEAANADATNAGDVATDATASSGAKGTASESQQPEKKHSGAFTPKKGRPTPKRNEVERERGIRRGPVEAPLTAKERERAERREQRRIADERMAAGDPRYMLPRDQGAERKFVRDWVDSRRFLANVFLPFALILLLIMMIGTSLPKLANIASLIAMVLIIALIIEGIYIGRRAIKLTRERFPKTTEGAWGLGFYAYSRASQPRRLRTPRPQVNIGDEIK